MKGNRELDDLLLSYILKELNEEEDNFVQEYIRSDENNRRHFEEIRDMWKAITIKKGLEKVNMDDEWELFEQRMQREKQQLVAIRTDTKTEDEQPMSTEEGRKGRRKRNVVVSMAVAAALSAVIVAGWLLLQPRRQEVVASGGIVPKTVNSLARLKHSANSTGKPERLWLPDGSEVILADKSEISYAEKFTDDKRDITLIGKAEFKVAQDKSRPFTVYSMGLATTALGTVFTISAFDQEENVIIRLHEGKIVIKTAEDGKARLKQDYYLLPGQSLIYNNRNYTAKLLDARKKKDRPGAGTRDEESYTDLPNLPENNKGSWYMFNNESLASVFDQLELLYDTEIVYEKKDMHNLYFAGKFDKSDSLSTILRQIAAVNNLKVTKRNNKYIITK
jgi:ferric-dicitrate binding protein FerR (iron transport regulator)